MWYPITSEVPLLQINETLDEWNGIQGTALTANPPVRQYQVRQKILLIAIIIHSPRSETQSSSDPAPGAARLHPVHDAAPHGPCGRRVQDAQADEGSPHRHQEDPEATRRQRGIQCPVVG